MGADIVELSTENGALRNKIDTYDDQRLEDCFWLEEKAKLLKQIDDDKKANLNMSKMQKQMKSVK